MLSGLFRSLFFLFFILFICLAALTGLFLFPFFQADTMLARVLINDVQKEDKNNCYIVDLEIFPEGSKNDPLKNNSQQKQTIISNTKICGDYIGLGYEFALPEKAMFFMKKPGINITNLVALDSESKNMSSNITIGAFKYNWLDKTRSFISRFVNRTPLIKSYSYDIKSLPQVLKKDAIINFYLEPLRQQVVVDCESCSNSWFGF